MIILRAGVQQLGPAPVLRLDGTACPAPATPGDDAITAGPGETPPFDVEATREPAPPGR
ncbi:hypothetical protein [Saccharopolyspora elongata]|uniref:hypothetical protein n=1 Tax=Saccharopolyspora elongata TaxID=2530387 RepID=UPI001404CAA8|nr:hypothetical protein [Saccharopolyspora elongata]